MDVVIEDSTLTEHLAVMPSCGVQGVGALPPCGVVIEETKDMHMISNKSMIWEIDCNLDHDALVGNKIVRINIMHKSSLCYGFSNAADCIWEGISAYPSARLTELFVWRLVNSNCNDNVTMQKIVVDT